MGYIILEYIGQDWAGEKERGREGETGGNHTTGIISSWILDEKGTRPL